MLTQWQQNPGANILSEVSKTVFNEVRSNLVSTVLATDMKHHFDHLEHVKSALAKVGV